jgi:hypothetical protein
MANILHIISLKALALFDRLIFLHSRCMNNDGMQFLGALFFVSSAALAAAMFGYWIYCALRILEAGDTELTDAELDALWWPKRMWEEFLHAFLFGRLTLP